MAELTPQAQKAMAEVDLLAGETIERVFQADGFFLGTNPMAKAIAAINSFIVKITGGHVRLFLILTNRRVLMVTSNQVCCGYARGRTAMAIALSSIKEAGVARETQVCCFHTRLIHVQSLTQRHTLIVKKFSDQDLKEFLSYMSEKILANTTSI
jgi:hypothetical protein